MAGLFSSNRIDISSWTNYSPVSVCFWFYANPTLTRERVFGSDDLWEIRITDAWVVPATYRLSNELFGSTTGTPPQSTTIIAASTWYHTVCTATSGGTASVYINGVSEASANCVAYGYNVFNRKQKWRSRRRRTKWNHG